MKTLKSEMVDDVAASLQFSRYLADLKHKRENGRLTQENVASEMGVSYQSVNRWENTSFVNATVSNLIGYLKVLENHQIDTRF